MLGHGFSVPAANVPPHMSVLRHFLAEAGDEEEQGKATTTQTPHIILVTPYNHN